MMDEADSAAILRVGFTVGGLFNVAATMLGARMRNRVETEAADPSRPSQNDESQSSFLDPSDGVEGRIATASADEDMATPVSSPLTEVAEVGFDEARYRQAAPLG